MAQESQITNLRLADSSRCGESVLYFYVTKTGMIKPLAILTPKEQGSFIKMEELEIQRTIS